MHKMGVRCAITIVVLLLGACINKLCGTTETCVPLSNGAGVCINTVITCPSTWIRMGSNCFYFSGEKRTLIDSKLQCEASRGSLASISTRGVYNFIASKLIAGSEDFWVGAVRDSTGTWIWTGTGQELSFPYWIYASFSNGTDEDCMRLTSLGFLFDQYCDKVYPYICQI